MSFNVDSVECQILEAWMLKKDIRRLLKKHEGDLPENNFLEDHADDAADEAGRVKLRTLSWCDSWSGNSWELLVKTIAPKIQGQAVAIFIWEGGEHHSGLVIKDGQVEECKVRLSVVKPKWWTDK